MLYIYDLLYIHLEFAYEFDNLSKVTAIFI